MLPAYSLCSGYKADKHRNKTNKDRFGICNSDSIRKLDLIERAKQGSNISVTSVTKELRKKPNH